MTRINNLREQRTTLAKEVRALLDNHPGKLWGDEQQKIYDAKVDEINRADAEIKRLQDAADLDADKRFDDAVEQARKDGKLAPAASEDVAPKAMLHAFLRRGIEGFTQEQLGQYRNTMSTTTGSEGGYTVPSLISSTLYDYMKAYGAMRAVAEIIRTADGRPLSFPTSDGTAEVGELIGQNTTATAADPTFGTVALNVYKYSSKIVAVPFELLQDSTIDIEAFVLRRLAQRIGRIGNQHFTTGTGSGQPNGLITASTVGKTGTTGQTTTIIYDDLVDLIHSVDPAYRFGSTCAFTTNDSLLKVIRKLKDSQNRPLWVPSFERGIVAGVGANGGYEAQDKAVFFDQLLGYPLYVNNDIATPAANAVTMSFGDHSFYKVRDAMDVQMFRFTDSAYTKLGQVGFLAWCRMGGNLVDTNAVKTYKHSAT